MSTIETLKPQGRELSEADQQLLNEQLERYSAVGSLPLPNTYRDRVEAGHSELVAGTLFHGADYTRELIAGVRSHGVLSGDLIGIPEWGETNYCADFFRVPQTMGIQEYFEWAGQGESQGRLRMPRMESRYLPTSRTKSARLAFLVDGTTPELANLLTYDAYNPAKAELFDGFIRRSYELGSDKAGRLAAVLVGVPFNAVSGVVVSQALAEQTGEIQFMKETFGEDLPIFDNHGNRL